MGKKKFKRTRIYDVSEHSAKSSIAHNGNSRLDKYVINLLRSRHHRMMRND